MLIDKIRYQKSLSVLWHSVFGDSYSFIDIIFKPEYDKDILCFAKLDGDKAVSAFYLISNALKYENNRYNGYYLYAAATLPDYRKSGFMSELIAEAQLYCKQSGADFISLVPSEESLYSYYARFGFVSAMYRNVSHNDGYGKSALLRSDSLVDSAVLAKIRSAYEGNMMLLEGASLAYAAECYNASGAGFVTLSGDSCYLFSKEDNTVTEFISSDKNFTQNVQNFKNEISSCSMEISSPFELPFCSDNKKIPYGMLYPVNDNLLRDWSFTDIYMNIALD